MNLAFTPVTRRAIPINYQSPGLFSYVSASSSSGSSVAFLETFKLAGPVLTVTDLGSSLKVSWTPIPDAALYLLYRSTTLLGPYTIYVSGVAGTEYVDTPTLAGTYYYKVVAIEPNAGQTEFSNEGHGTV